MIEVTAHTGEGFRVAAEYGEWKIGLLAYSERFSRLTEMERHTETDEAFVLLSGNAVLCTEHQQLAMREGCVYNVPVGVWHHVVVSRDALVLVVENRRTSKENTEKQYFDEKEIINAYR